MAYQLAEGEEFLGITPPRPLRVLYVDYESPLDVFVEQAEKIGTSKNLYFMDPGCLPKGPALIKALEAMIQVAHYDLVIVDPLMAFTASKFSMKATEQMGHFHASATDQRRYRARPQLRAARRAGVSRGRDILWSGCVGSHGPRGCGDQLSEERPDSTLSQGGQVATQESQ
jgi:hypothetical protein